MSLFARFFVIAIAGFIATLAAGLTISLGVLLPNFWGWSSDPSERAIFYVVTFFATGLAAIFSMLPTLVAIALAETFAWRSFIYYAGVGALIGALAYFGSDYSGRLDYSTDMEPVRFPLQVSVAAGIVWGLVYWLIAGRNAGRWRETFPA